MRGGGSRAVARRRDIQGGTCRHRHRSATTARRASSHAVSLLEQLGPEARVVAGGHSLLPMMKLRLARPEHLVDINDLAGELSYIRIEGDELCIGAMTRHAELLASAVAGEHFRILHDAERVIADPVVRNRGTVGGSLCQGDPSEDLSAVFAALKATVVITGGSRHTDGGRRASSTSVRTRRPSVTPNCSPRSACRSGQAVRAPTGRSSDGPATGLSPPSVRPCGWTATRSADAGIGLTAVGAEHFCAPAAEDALRGATISDDVIERAGALAAENVNPATDQRGPAEYKRHLAGELTKRALRTAIGRAERRSEHEHHGHGQRRVPLGRHRAAGAARPPAARPIRTHRDALGMRHLQLRGVRRAASTGCR